MTIAEPSAQATPAWITDMYAKLDVQDIDGFVKYFAADGVFIFGNAPAYEGEETIRAMVVQFFSAIKAISHDDLQAWVVDDTAIMRGKVTYTRHDDSTLTNPFAVIATMRDDLIAVYQVYVDNSQLFG